MVKKLKKTKEGKEKHYFFLNKYSDMSFTRCPKCETKTKIRKFCLVVFVEPNYFLTIYKYCRYCVNCDLIIAKQDELEGLMSFMCERNRLDIIGNKYFVIGTLDKKNFELTHKKEISKCETIERICLFKNVLNFDIMPRGWYLNE